MGGIDLYFVDTKAEVRCRQKVVDFTLYHLSTSWFFIIGCATSAPDISISRLQADIL
jgi:hypothetical protein